MNNDYTDVIGIVEVTSYETLCLWQEWHQKRGYTWIESRSGPLITVGKIDNRPVCIAPLVHVVANKPIMFLEVTSELVDWKMIDKWLWDNAPSAHNGTSLMKTNAMNFHTLFTSVNKEQAIQWCKENNCNFIDPVFPPPEDWVWCENGSMGLTLQCISTVKENEPIIYPSEVK